METLHVHRIRGRSVVNVKSALMLRGSISTSKLFLRLARLGAALRGVALGHVAGQSTNVVLQKFVLVLQFIMVVFHGVDPFCQCLKRRLKRFGLSKKKDRAVSILLIPSM